MSAAVDPLLVLILMLNFLMLGTSRLRTAIKASAAQGVLLGVLLDLLVAIFVIGIVINHINREFASIDAAELDTLKE